jgi:hypothetical protein
MVLPRLDRNVKVREYPASSELRLHLALESLREFFGSGRFSRKIFSKSGGDWRKRGG